MLVAGPALGGCLGRDPIAVPASSASVPAFPCVFPCDRPVGANPSFEWEPAVAVNPKDPQNVVMGVYATDSKAGPRLISYATHDGGATWARRELPGAGAAAAGSNWNRICGGGDPFLVFRPDGTAVLGGLGYACGPGGDVDLDPVSPSTVFITRSRDGGLTWGEPVFVSATPNVVQTHDKPWAAVDPKTGHLAVVWDSDTLCLWEIRSYLPRGLVPFRLFCSYGVQHLMVGISKDGGDTWKTALGTLPFSSPIALYRVGPPYPPFATLGLVPAWGATGELFVSTSGNYPNGDMVVLVTRDDGLTWSWYTPRNFGPLYKDDPELGDGWRYPVIDVDRSGGPHDGRLYLSYWDGPEGGDLDMQLIWSDDAGRTWADPLRLNTNPSGDGTDQYHHWMDVDERGVVHAVFFDRLDDGDNLTIQRTYSRYDPESQLVSSTVLSEPWSFTPELRETAWLTMGHYETIAASGGTVATAWTRLAAVKPDQDEFGREQGYDLDIHAAIFRDAPPA